MKLVQGLQAWQACLSRTATQLDGTVCTIGNFDGVHLGHAQMLRQVTTTAKKMGLLSVAVSFEPLPQEYFRGEQAPQRLHGLRNRVLSIGEQGVDYLVLLRFDEALAQLSPEAFITDILVNTLRVHHLVVGDDFRFGRSRAGSIDTLRAAGPEHGFSVEDTVTVSSAEERVSSTRIRAALANHELDLAALLLGRPYRIDGRVVHGEKVGRQLGFPTANIALKALRPPLAGVFAVKVHDHDTGLDHPGVANLGERPTVGGRKLLLEVHLLDGAAELYGHHLAVDFLHFIRGEQRFDSLDALKYQIGEDAREARALLREPAR